MAQVTYFVVLPFTRAKRGQLVEGQPLTAQSAEQARRMAERLSRQHDGVVAFSRSGDPDFGDWDDAVVLAAYGAVPPDVEPAAMAVSA